MKAFLLFMVSVLLGAVFNSMILNIGMEIIPPPTGYDMNNPNDLSKAMSVMETRHFLFPFLSHAIGTLVAVVIYTYFIKSKRKIAPILIASIFFSGGLYMVLILPAPLWFELLDLTLCFFPMAAIGYTITKRKD